jgi:hemolysin activation/secretion protein
VYQGQSLNYRVPLPRRHSLQVSTSYSQAKPEFYGGLFVQDGETITGDVRYTAPLQVKTMPVEVYAAASFKESNNNLEFGGTSVQSSKTDTFHLTTGFSALRRDRFGGWILGAALTGSPGNVNSRNTDAVFDPVRLGAKSRYLFGSLSLQRVIVLRRGWELSGRATYQLASTNLLVNEQLYAGGANTVRGFAENTSIGDEGLVLSQELASPYLKKNFAFLTKLKLPPLETRAVAFFDAATIRRKHEYAFERPISSLSSVGVGIRSVLPGRLSLTADYGWQLADLPYPQNHRARAHVKLVLAY